MAKINISLPDELLEQVETLSDELGRSRSGFVAEATARYVTAIHDERERVLRLSRIDDAVARAEALGARLGPVDGTTSVREDRDRSGRKAGKQ